MLSNHCSQYRQQTADKLRNLIDIDVSKHGACSVSKFNPMPLNRKGGEHHLRHIYNVQSQANVQFQGIRFELV